jgi:ABC-2 type transport system ATP-binding protein
MDTPAIRTVDLRRTYRQSRRERKAAKEGSPAEFVALESVNLEVAPGELFGLLGPNGAGKTTLIKILTTLLAPTSGSAQVDGLDVFREAHALRPRINMVSGGESCGYGVLTVRENLWLFAQIYGVSTAEAKRRIDAMLEVVDMADKANAKVSHLSTGQRQKMNFCRGFITDPKVLFLDEPTLGLDVTAARSIRRFVREWLREKPGRTLLLTTHYMSEADELCDRLAVIDHGKVLACDTPSQLKRQVQKYPIFQISVTPGPNGWHELGQIPGVHQATASAGPSTVDLKVALEDEAAVSAVVQHIVANQARIVSLTKVEPTLEDVFIEMVGHGLLAEGERA